MTFRGRHISITAGIVVIAVVVGLGALTYIRRPRLTPELRGFELARDLGCFACHGPAGTGGVPNPGSEEERIPAWDGGNAMMYVQSEREIEEWILFGRPERLARQREQNGGAAPPVRMPAYRDVLTGADLEDLVAYYKAVAVFEPMPPDARDGYKLASGLGCFGCHGPGGRVGAKNPGSFKGYIPPWRGPDFQELVADGDELRQWIRDGTIERFESNWAARRFTRRQVIQMPAYRTLLDDGELESLVAYINWLQKETQQFAD